MSRNPITINIREVMIKEVKKAQCPTDGHVLTSNQGLKSGTDKETPSSKGTNKNLGHFSHLQLFLVPGDSLQGTATHHLTPQRRESMVTFVFYESDIP